MKNPIHNSLPDGLGQERVLSARQAAELCGISVATFRRQHWARRLPPAIRLSERRLGWRAKDLLAHIESRADTAAEPEMRWVMNFILGVRQIRGEMDIAPSRKLEVLLLNCGALDSEYASRNLVYLSRLAGIMPPRILAKGEAAPIAAVALLGTLEILVPMAGLIDPKAELERLAKRRRKTETDLGKLQGKLDNAEFARNAPADVVEKDRLRLAELRTELRQLTAQIARVTALQTAALP